MSNCPDQAMDLMSPQFGTPGWWYAMTWLAHGSISA